MVKRKRALNYHRLSWAVWPGLLRFARARADDAKIVRSKYAQCNVHKKVLNFVGSRRFGNNPFISRLFQPLGQNQTFTVHARQMMHMLFETCAREELNKLELYVHAAGGKRFKFEDNPSFFSLSVCSTPVHLLDHRCLTFADCRLQTADCSLQMSDTAWPPTLSCPGCCCGRPD